MHIAAKLHKTFLEEGNSPVLLLSNIDSTCSLHVKHNLQKFFLSTSPQYLNSLYNLGNLLDVINMTKGYSRRPGNSSLNTFSWIDKRPNTDGQLDVITHRNHKTLRQ